MKKCTGIRGCGRSIIALSALIGGSHAATAASTGSDAAPAGEEPSSSAQLEEVVVTAQRRSESLQTTSIIVDVVSAQSLERNGITQVQSLTTLLPGVQIGTAGSALQIYIRGVGDFGSTANTNPAIAFNIDGVYVGRSQSIGSEFYDVARVEVLKGPQGTLYGRNASGGAINALTRAPRLGEYTGDFSTEVGNYNDYTVEGGVNLPLAPTLAVRLSGTYVNKGGFTTQGYGDDKREAGRLRLLWAPSSDLSLLLNASGGHIGGKGTDYVLVNKVPGLTSQTPWTDASDPSVKPFIVANASPTLPHIPGLVDVAGPRDGYQDMNFYNVSAQLDADLGFAKLTVLPAYRHSSLLYNSTTLVLYQVGKAFGPYPETPESSKQKSVEIRLANETDALKWVLGGYFYDENQYSQYVTYNGLIANSGNTYTYDTRSYSGFGQATYSLSQAFRLIGGLRYTSDHRAIDGSKNNVAPTLSCPLARVVCPVEAFTGATTFSNVSWKAGIEADLAPKSLLFATVSTGFKAGGFNSEIAPQSAAGSHAAYGFRPEKLTAYELGLKNRFLDDRLQVNMEGFYWNYKDHQEPFVAVSGAGNPGLVFENAGKARSFGGSVDVVAKPWRNGTFNANAEWIDSKYSQFIIDQPAAFVFPNATGCNVKPTSLPPGRFGPILGLDCSGFALTHAPRWSGSVGYTHDISLGDAGSLEANATMQFASSRWLAADFVPAELAPSYRTVNAALTYLTPSKLITVTGFVRNMTNAVAYQGALEGPFLSGIVAANIAPPRTYGVRLGVHF